MIDFKPTKKVFFTFSLPAEDFPTPNQTKRYGDILARNAGFIPATIGFGVANEKKEFRNIYIDVFADFESEMKSACVESYDEFIRERDAESSKKW